MCVAFLLPKFKNLNHSIITIGLAHPRAQPEPRVMFEIHATFDTAHTQGLRLTKMERAHQAPLAAHITPLLCHTGFTQALKERQPHKAHRSAHRSTLIASSGLCAAHPPFLPVPNALPTLCAFAHACFLSAGALLAHSTLIAPDQCTERGEPASWAAMLARASRSVERFCSAERHRSEQ